MPPLGTAPRRVGGRWVTRTGRVLSEAGQGYWDRLYEAGRTDALGHLTRPQTVGGKPSLVLKPQRVPYQRPAPPEQPTRLQMALAQAASQGQTDPRRPDVREAIRVTRAYNARGTTLAHQLGGVARAVGHGLERQALGVGRILGLEQLAPQRQWGGGGTRTARGPVPFTPQPWMRTVAGVGQLGKESARTASELAVGPSLTALATGGKATPLGIGTDVAFMLPFLKPVRGARAALAGARELTAGERTVQAARQAAGETFRGAPLFPARRPYRTLDIGDRSVQIPSRSQSRVTEALIDRPADIFSSRFPNLPVAGSRARAIRHAGRAEADEIRRGRVAMEPHIKALPKEGSNEDVAHFWWAQLPTSMRNREGLQAVRDRLQTDLEGLTSAPVGGGKRVRATVQADQPQRAKDLASTIARMDEVIGADVAHNPRTIEAVRALSGARKENLIGANILKPETASEREKLVTRWVTGAKYETPTPGKLGKPSAALLRRRQRVERMQGVYDKAVERSKELVEKSRTPLTREEAISHLDDLERHHEGLIADVQKGWKTDMDEVRRRNTERWKYAKGKRLTQPITVKEEQRQVAIDILDKLAEKHAGEHWAEAYKSQRDKISQLRNAIGETDPLVGEREVVAGEFGRRDLPTRSLYDPRVTRLGGALSVAKDELERAEKAALARIKPTGVLGGEAPEGGGEIFLGHRQDTPRGAFGIRHPGAGKRTKPQGAGQLNKMDLLSSGRVRMTTHVAAQDWGASQTYKDAGRIRDALFQMGDELPQVEGQISEKAQEGMMLINPEGDPVPRGWKTDRLAQLMEGGGSDKLHSAASEVLRSTIGDERNWEEIVKAAKATGVADKLRMLPEKEVERFYRQFTPMAPGTTGGKTYDKLVDATAASLIFARLGYIPKNVAQNLIMAVPHQGPRIFGNVARAMQLAPVRTNRSELDTHLWDLLASEVGGGAAGSVAKETTMKAVLGKPAQAMTGIADTPLRVSALLHTIANKGVIDKWGTKLSEADKAKLLDFLTNPANRPDLNEAMQTAKDAMADFDRMNPTTRKWARRFLIVPGWLAAGTRYPAKFATSYPGRTAAIGYAATGEPGLPEESRLPQNRPVWQYFTGGTPSFLQGIKTGPNEIFRTSSLFPASLPADIGIAAAEGSPIRAYDYANPLIGAGINIARGQVEKASGETINKPFWSALGGNLQRLAPAYSYGRDIIQGPKGEGLYPTKSRWERTKRELGVTPVKYSPEVAERMRASERGMTRTVQAMSDQQDLEKALDAAGYEADDSLKRAWKIKLDRNKRLDSIKAHGLTYQQKAYRSDVEYAQKLGILSKEEAKSYLGDLEGATESEIDQARRGMAREWFGGNAIAEAKKQLRDATAGG